MKKKFRWFCLIGLALAAGCGGDGAPEAAAAETGAEELAEAELALGAGDLKKAVELLGESIAKCGTNVDSRVQMALAQLRLGDMGAADKATGELLAVCPDSAEAWLLAGQVAYYRKDYDRAMEIFGEVAFCKELPKKLRSEGLTSRAVVQMAQKKFEDARVNLFRARRLNPSNAAAWYHLGVLSMDVYRVREAAVEQFEMAARLLNAGDPRAQKLSRVKIPELRKAIAAEAAKLAAGVKADEAGAKRLVEQAKALLAKKQTTNARKRFAEALKLDPRCYDAAVGWAEMIGSPKTKADTDKALELYRLAIDLKPYKQDLYLAAARVAYRRDRWIEAAEILNRALAHDSENKQTLDLLIAAMQKTGHQVGMLRAYRSEL